MLQGTFELWQGKRSIEVSLGVILIQPGMPPSLYTAYYFEFHLIFYSSSRNFAGTTYRIKYTGSSIGVILFHIYEK